MDETVPVYAGRLRLLQDVLLRATKDTAERAQRGEPLDIVGTLRFQICSDTVCFPPSDLRVGWQLKLEPPIRERAPEHLRRD